MPAPLASAQSSYSEKLNVYVAGSDALWYMTLGGINGSAKLSGLESSPGLSWYNITAVRTTTWQSDFQTFGSNGYRLLPSPSPSQGLYLTVGSDSYADALTAAAAAGSYLLASFVSSSNGTGTYTFYSPLSFNDLIPLTLFSFLPSGAGGFVNAIIPSSLDSTLSPMVVLEGTKSGSTFNHTLVVGSISASALDSSGRPNILGYFGTAVTSLKASSHSTSSTINVRLLDGILNASSKDNATVSVDTSSFSGSYSLNLAPGKSITRLNATVVQQPAVLLAYRAVDKGVIHTGDNLSVTVTLKSLSPAAVITKLAFSDNWWNSTGAFTLVSASNSTTFPTSMAPGGTVTPVYVLHYSGNTTGSVTIPPSVVRYSYTVNGVLFKGQTVLNSIRLSLGADDAVVYAYSVPSGGVGKSIGSPQNLNVTVVNVGTLPASTVTAAGLSVSGLAASGGTASVSVTQNAPSLTSRNVTQTYAVTYQDPGGSHLNATSNVFYDIFSHTQMKLAYPTVVVSPLMAFLPSGALNLTLTYAVANSGPANSTSFIAVGNLPAGLGCGATSGIGISCSGGRVVLNYTVVTHSGHTAYMKYNVTSPVNYILPPLSLNYTTSGYSLSGISNALAIPSGLTLSKTFTPSQLFGGMNSRVGVVANDAGPLPFYNATVSAIADAFDTVTGPSATTKTVSTIAPGGSVGLNFTVKVGNVYGNLTATRVTARFYFGATQFTIQSSATKVLIYQPLRATITTNPASPIEGKDFTLTVVISNPSGVPVSNVLFNFPVPGGLSLSQLTGAQLSGGNLTISSQSLGADQNITATGAAVAGSGIVVPFDKASLTFVYNGVTVNGNLPSKGIAVGEDVTTRYVIPTAIVLLAMLAVAFYLRKLAAPSVPSSQQ